MIRKITRNLSPTKYFVMSCHRREGDAHITQPPRLPSPMDNWIGGQRWNQEVPEPLVFRISEADQGKMRPYCPASIPLMSIQLIEALNECGVDNLDCYRAEIHESETGIVHSDYKAVNIVGLIAAADLAGSDFAPSAIDSTALIDTFFRSLALDESAIHGQLLFRLAEKVSAIIVHDSVKTHLTDLGFDQLSFSHPGNWAG